MLRVAVGLGPFEGKHNLEVLYTDLDNIVTQAVGNHDFTIVLVFGDFSQFTKSRRLAAKLWLEGASVVQLDGKTIIQMSQRILT